MASVPGAELAGAAGRMRRPASVFDSRTVTDPERAGSGLDVGAWATAIAVEQLT